MVQIRGRWECAVEYLDRCIGGQRIADVVQHGKAVYYIFENGHKLPLLCFCCGTPLVVASLEKTRRNMRGRRLEAMSTKLVLLNDGSQMPQFRLEFSRKGLLSRAIYEPVSPQVAAHLRHPPGCPNRPGKGGASG